VVERTLNPESISGGMTVSVIADAASYEGNVPVSLVA
jgi:hypothetical protein